MTAVTPVPSKKPLSGVPVSRYNTTSSLLPATFFSPSPISAMPNRNSATPLSSEIKFPILISKNHPSTRTFYIPVWPKTARNILMISCRY